ncbi:MAG: hypothetical protein LBI84_10320 [Propionibacteriaceae bacterium]|jgi:lambda repressor-like predicted transcriptional regulator|nr:hypothetical protein [Propionibacteriaceae bacterium]
MRGVEPFDGFSPDGAVVYADLQARLLGFVEQFARGEAGPTVRLVDMPRSQSILRDGPAGSRLVLDPEERRPPAVAGTPVPGALVGRSWRRGDPGLTRVVAADRARGLTQMEIAAKRGVHVQTVRRHLARSGLAGRNSMTPDQIAEARQFRAAGWSLRDLGQRYGVAHTTVARAVNARVGGAG